MNLRDILSRLPGAKPGSVVLELDLARGLIDGPPARPLEKLRSLGSTELKVLRERLHKAATDADVKGLIVHAAGPGQTGPVMEEVADLVEEFGQHKPTVAWSESFGEFDSALFNYVVASAAHEVWLQPTGELGIAGAELRITLLRGLLEKVGIDPQFGQRKEYKTAADQFAARHISDANREMMQSLAQSVVEDAVTVIARRRGRSTDEVWDAVHNSPLTAADAQARGLVDHIGYRDQVYAACLDAWDADSDDLCYVHRHDGFPSFNLGSRPAVAVVSVRGGIVTGRGAPGPNRPQAASDVVDEHLRAALRDDDVKAVLVEVDSGGGSAVASDFIHRSIECLKEAGKPVVARMGSVAASGGYYVAMAADEIVAQRSTLTGSIGVLAGKFVTQGLMERLGVVREPVRVGERAGMYSPLTGFDEDEWHKLDEELDRIYRDFTQLAAKDRGMDHDQLESLARGRVWTGAQAHEVGLIDHLGGWRTAWERVCDLADIDPERARVERIESGWLSQLKSPRSSESISGARVAQTVETDPVERLFQRLAAHVGLEVPGVLSLPVPLVIR